MFTKEKTQWNNVPSRKHGLANQNPVPIKEYHSSSYGQGYPRDLKKNKNYYFPWLPARKGRSDLATEDITYSGHRIWRNQFRSDLYAITLRTASYSVRR